MNQNEAIVSQNLGISNLRLSYVIPARMNMKNLPILEANFHKEYTQEGENNNSCAKSIRENNLQQPSPTDKGASVNKGCMRRNAKISKENKEALCSIAL